MDRTSILHLSADLHLAGAQNVLIGLINGLDREKFKSHVLSLKGGILAERIDQKYCTLTIMRPDSVFDFKIIRKILEIIRQDNVRIIHAHGFDAGYYGAIASAISKETVCLLHYHGRYWKEKLRRRLITWLACFLAQKVVCASWSLTQEMKKTLYLPQDKLIALYNGIDFKGLENPGHQQSLRDEFKLGEDIVLIGNVANLYPVKGQKFLIEAAKIIIDQGVNARFLIVGDGPLKEALKNQARELGIENEVLIAGQREDIPAILSSLDVFVLCSLSEEISLALLEAMAARKPVVVTDVGGNKEVVDAGVNGLLVKPYNAEELAAAIIRCIRDKELSTKISQQAFEKISREFNLKMMINNIEKLYETLLDLKRQ